MLFFTADHHFNHSNVIRHCSRPFASVEEMNKVLIDRWNSVVGPDDVVYHLGDFCFGGRHAAMDKFRQLNGSIHILYNPWHHDSRWLPDGICRTMWMSSKSFYVVKLELPITVLKFPEYGDGVHDKTLVLSHYPQLFWDCKHYGSWHLFGHSHGRTVGNGLSFDVGVDCNEFTPVSMDQVVEKMKELENG